MVVGHVSHVSATLEVLRAHRVKLENLGRVWRATATAGDYDFRSGSVGWSGLSEKGSVGWSFLFREKAFYADLLL